MQCYERKAGTGSLTSPPPYPISIAQDWSMRLCSADTDNEFHSLTLLLRNIASELRAELEGSEPLVSGGGGNFLCRAAQQGWTL